MKLTAQLAIASASIATAFLATATATAATQTDIHRDAAVRNTGTDAFMLQYAKAFYCNLPDDNNQIVINARLGNGVRIPLTQIFDNVWYVGSRYVGQYLIKTDSGIAMVDAGNNAAEIQAYDYPALQAIGYSASFPLKEIFLTHGHGDHDGGAPWLRSNTTVGNIYLGSADAAGKTYAPTLMDSTNLSMQPLNVGGVPFTILPTPGHTPGSTSAVLTVKDGGKDVRVLINGGQSMTSAIPDVVKYLDSIERTYAMAAALNVDGVMTPHIYWDGTLEKLDEIQLHGRSSPSQFVFGHDTVLRQTAVARECSAAWLTRLDATVVTPVWRVNAVDFAYASPIGGRFSAKVSNGWNSVAGKQVTFKHVASGATCQANTDASGVATCGSAFGPFNLGTDITVSVAGASTADFVDLPTEKTTAFGNGCSDLGSARAAMGAKLGSAAYVARLDVDGNGVIDIRDIAGISRAMTAGTTCQ